MTMYVNEHECEYVSMLMDGCVSACVIKCEYVCVCVCVGYLMGKGLTHRQLEPC